MKWLWNCTIGALQISYRSTMINPPLYCAIWKTNRFLNISPVSKQIQWRSTESILYNIGECCLMNAYIGTVTLIRFAHPLWNTLGFLITSETLFHCKNQNSPRRPLSIHENSMVQKRLDHARKKTISKQHIWKISYSITAQMGSTDHYGSCAQTALILGNWRRTYC